MKLSEAKTKAAKPAAKEYRLADGHGLTLFVMPHGSKLWRIRIYQRGKENMLSLGSYPVVTLAQARAHALELRRQAADDDVFLTAARKYARTMTAERATELLRDLAKINPPVFAESLRALVQQNLEWAKGVLNELAELGPAARRAKCSFSADGQTTQTRSWFGHFAALEAREAATGPWKKLAANGRLSWPSQRRCKPGWR